MNQTLKSKLTFSKKSVFWLHRRSSQLIYIIFILNWKRDRESMNKFNKYQLKLSCVGEFFE